MANDSATAGFVMNQTMLRVRDPDVSVAFYRDVLGMTELARYDFEDMQFSLYFMGYLADGEHSSPGALTYVRRRFGRPGHAGRRLRRALTRPAPSFTLTGRRYPVASRISPTLMSRSSSPRMSG